VSDDVKERIRQANIGRTHSDDTKKKMSESHKGKQPMLGKRHSEETKRKMSEARMGKPAMRGK
jgi:hypothetical protein